MSRFGKVRTIASALGAVLALAGCAVQAGAKALDAAGGPTHPSVQGSALADSMSPGGGKACEAIPASAVERVYGPGFQSMGGNVDDHWQCQYFIKTASSYHGITIRLTLGSSDGWKVQLQRTGLAAEACAALTGLGDRSCWGAVASDGRSQATSSMIVDRGSESISVTEQLGDADYAASARKAARLLQNSGWGDPAIDWATAVLPTTSPVQHPSAPTPTAPVSHSPALDACSRLTADAVRDAFALDVAVRAASQGPMCMFTSDALGPSDGIYAYQVTVMAFPGAAANPNPLQAKTFDTGEAVNGVGDRAAVVVLSPPRPGTAVKIIDLVVASGPDRIDFQANVAQVPNGATQDAALRGLIAVAHRAGF